MDQELEAKNALGMPPTFYRKYAKKNDETFGNPTIWGGTAEDVTFVTPILPSGYPIQVVYTSTSAQGSTINTGTEFYMFQGTITPQFTNSRIVAFGAINGVDNESSGRLWIKMRAGTASAGTTGSDICQANIAQNSKDTNGVSSAFLAGTYASPGTIPVYVKIILQKQDAGGTPSGWINRFFDQSSIILTEVK